MTTVEKVVYRVGVKADTGVMRKFTAAIADQERKMSQLRDETKDLASIERRLRMQRKDAISQQKSLRANLRALLADRKRAGGVTSESAAAERKLRKQLDATSAQIANTARASRTLANARANLADETTDLARAQAKLRSSEAASRKLESLTQRSERMKRSTAELRDKIALLNRRLDRTAAGGMRRFGRGLGRISRKALQSATSVEGLRKSARGLGRVTASAARTAAVGVTAVGAGVVGLGTGVAKTGAEFESLKTALATVTGSSGAADIAFGNLTKFAKETPFDLQQVVDGYIKLQARGLDPSERSMRSFGNTAAGMGKSLDQMIEAVADASAGEFERLKEFGIKANKAGENVTFTFKGVKTTVGANAEEINKFLTSIGENDFAGGMDAQAKTLNGLLSNLGDSVSVFTNDVFQSEFGEALKEAAQDLIELVSGGEDLAKTLGGTLADAVRDAVSWIKSLAGDSNTVKETFKKWLRFGKDLLGMLMTMGSVIASVVKKLGGANTAILALGVAVTAVAGPFGALAVAAAAAGVAMAQAFESAESRAMRFSTNLMRRRNKLQRALNEDAKKQLERIASIDKIASKDARNLTKEELQFLEEEAPDVARNKRRRRARDTGFEGEILAGEKLGSLRETRGQSAVNTALKEARDRRGRAAAKAAERRARREGITLEEARAVGATDEASIRHALDTKIKRAGIEAEKIERARITGRVTAARKAASGSFGKGEKAAVRAALGALDDNPGAKPKIEKKKGRKKDKRSGFEKARDKEILDRAKKAGDIAASRVIAAGGSGKEAAARSREAQKETKERLEARDTLPGEVDRSKLKLAGFADVAGGRAAPPIIVNNNNFNVKLDATFQIPQSTAPSAPAQARNIQAHIQEFFEQSLRTAVLNVQSEVIG